MACLKQKQTSTTKQTGGHEFILPCVLSVLCLWRRYHKTPLTNQNITPSSDLIHIHKLNDKHFHNSVMPVAYLDIRKHGVSCKPLQILAKYASRVYIIPLSTYSGCAIMRLQDNTWARLEIDEIKFTSWWNCNKGSEVSANVYSEAQLQTGFYWAYLS